MTAAVRPIPESARNADDFSADLNLAAAALEEALAQRDLPHFYRVFRTTRLPFFCVEMQDDAARLFPACFEVVHRLGAISPAVALAVENHYYVTSAIATFPTESDADLHRRRQELMARIASERLIVANTNSKAHGAQLGALGTLARREGSGFRISGTASYTSIATEADLLVLLTELEGEGFALFWIAPMQNNPGVQIGPYLFPTAMIDSDTRKITFSDLVLPEESLIATSKNRLADALFPFEMAWHQLLIPALYLGSAARAIEEARLFLRGTTGRDGRPLAELDGMIIDVGRLAIEYQSARMVVEKAGQALAEVRELPRDARRVEEAVMLAGAAKYTGTRAAEAIVTAARRIVGARAFAGGNALERLSQEVLFASLGPEVSAVIERRFGRQALEERAFVKWARNKEENGC